jgi:hypothetical protein
MEFDVHDEYIHMALPWSMVAELVSTIAPLAFEGGLGLYDPQRSQVALPAPFGVQAMDTAGIEQHEDQAAFALNAIMRGAALGFESDPMIETNELLRGAGYTMMSPLGFEITPDIEAEARANPLRVPTPLQTPERKAALTAQLSEARADRRQQAAMMLGGWDPDPEVRAALLALLDSDDAFLAGAAATGIARQGRAEDFDVLLGTLHRMSPADGGTIESMWAPLTAAFELARAIGPEAVADVKAKARAWWQPQPGSKRRQSVSEVEFEGWLDMIASGPDLEERLRH